MLLISVADVYEALISLDINKFVAFDENSLKIPQSCAEALCESLHHLFTLSLHYAIVPSSEKFLK